MLASMPDPIEFSMQLQLKDAASVAKLAGRCEAGGFRALLVPDHPGSVGSPFVTLAAAAAATSTIRLGTAVLNAGIHEPLLLASDVATLDVLSDGRAELGLGAGHNPAEWAMVGRSMPGPRGRVEHLLRIAESTTALLAGERVIEHGTELGLGEPKPVQQRVPIMLGGGNPALLRWAGRHADAVGLAGLGRTLPDGHRHTVSWSTDQVDRHVGLVREAAEAAGRPAPAFEALVQQLTITNDREAAVAEFAERAELPVQRLLEVPYVLAGTVEQIAAELQRYRARWGITRYVVRADALDDAERVLAAVR